MKAIKITLPIEPKGQQRPRFTRIGKFHKAYKSKQQKIEESKVLAFLYQQRPQEPWSCAIKVAIKAFLPIPKSWSQKKKLEALNNTLRPTKKPDIDNLAKQVLDCMNGVFWQDDKQVVELSVAKYYCQAPRWEIEVKEVL